MARSMQPALDKIATMAQEPSTNRLAYSYRRGYEDGLSHGMQAAYRRMAYAAVVLVGACGVVSLVL